MVQPSKRSRLNSQRATELILFLILLFCYIYFFPRWADWSQNSRLDLTLAIVERGTLSIDHFYHNTGDYALFEGHYYTDKAPGPSFLAVPVYAFARPILQSSPVQSLLEQLATNSAFETTLQEEGTGMVAEKIYNAIVLYIITIAVVSVPAALLGVLFYRFLTELGARHTWSIAIVLIYGLATNAFPYAGVFYSHQLVAFLLFGAFFLGFQMRRGIISPHWTLAAGFMLGYAIISEYPSILIAAGVFLYVIFTLPERRWLSAFVMAGVPPGLLLMAYDWAIFRTPLPVGYKYSELYADLHSVGLVSLTYPHLDALWGITFGSFRGLFYVSPVLVLAVVGFWIWWRMDWYRAEWAVCLWATVSFILFNSSSVMWQGGFSIGPRYLVPMLPFLAVALVAFAVSHWGELLWIRALMVVLAAWSVIAVWIETLGGQQFPDWTPNPLFNYSLPNLAKGNIARNIGMVFNLSGWSSLFPLAVILAVGLYILTRRPYVAAQTSEDVDVKKIVTQRRGNPSPEPVLGRDTDPSSLS